MKPNYLLHLFFFFIFLPILTGSINPLSDSILISDQHYMTSYVIESTIMNTSLSNRLEPSNLKYQGASRVPMPEGEEYGWAYGGGGLSYYPAGDPSGSTDGYPGSLFGLGHDQKNLVTEISIPEPVISQDKDVDDLNTAETIQTFHDLNAGIFTDHGQGAPLKGDICYIEHQESQNSDHLYFTFAEHLEFELVPSLAGSNLSLSSPSVHGPWKIGNYSNFCTDDYLLEIPLSWATLNLPGYRMASGRFRDGSLGGSGPALFALAPWLDGNPPENNSELTHIRPLLLYEKGYEGSENVMAGYTNADDWSGGAWLTDGEKSALIFAGTKGRGDCWYGFSDGTRWPDEPPYPPIPPPPHDQRGWWADRFEGVIYFYDPSDLEKVASGILAPYEPQPYAELNVDQYLFNISGTQQKRHLGAMAFDRDRGHLYITEFRGDGDACLIHVWHIENTSRPPPTITSITPTIGYPVQNWPLSITGTNFRPNASVRINNSTVSKSGEIVSLSPTLIICILPVIQLAPGIYNVTVLNEDLTSAELIHEISPVLFSFTN